jgi:8-oxo-dGTP pyrophosphatase MutT (NUDIX family)
VSFQIDDSWYTRGGNHGERISAGGVVVRLDKGALVVALIREIDHGITLDGYVLPKGGIEPGETVDEAMRREIQEEAGLTELVKVQDLAILERLNVTKTLWSINHYGLFLTTQTSGTILDAEHHFDFGWFPLDALPPMYWPDERSLLAKQRLNIYDAVIAHQNPGKRKQRFM